MMTDTAEENEIEFTPTARGFVLDASLSTYAAIPIVAITMVATGAFGYWILTSWDTMSLGMRLYAPALAAVILGILWWFGLLRAFGTQGVTLEYPHLEISVGLGSLRYRRRVDVQEIASMAEAEGNMTQGGMSPSDGVLTFNVGGREKKMMAIVLQFAPSTPGLVVNKKRVAFGHFLTKPQRAYIMNRIRERVPALRRES
jgi:hypothetical protein